MAQSQKERWKMSVLSSQLMEVLKKSFDGREKALYTTISIFKEFSSFMNKVDSSEHLNAEEKKNLLMTMFNEMKYHIIRYPEEFMN